MPGTVLVKTERSRLVIAPSFGGAIASLEGRLRDAGWTAVLRPWSGRPEDGPFSMGSNVLVPFSNRISGGGFTFRDRFFPLSPNLAGEPCPIHGDGFQRAWTLEDLSDSHARLSCRGGSIGPFRYGAWQRFDLGIDSLRVTLGLTNLSGMALPFGAGFHPWFPRVPETRIAFSASSVWLQDETYLPHEEIPVERGGPWDFSTLCPLPETWINNGFEDWPRVAVITQPDITVTIRSSAGLSRAIVFSPSAAADFFCFEPVSHPVDAHNLPGQPGLDVLEPDQTLQCWMDLSWR